MRKFFCTKHSSTMSEFHIRTIIFFDHTWFHPMPIEVRCGIHMSDPSHFRTLFHALCCRKTSVYVAPTVYAGIFYTKIFHFFHKPICKIKLLLCRWHSLTILITLRIDHHILKQTFICSHNHPHLSLS